MSKTIGVITGNDGEKVYSYTGKFNPYDGGLLIGEIIAGLPDLQTARMCLTDIMATLAEYENLEEQGRLVRLPCSDYCADFTPYDFRCDEWEERK